MKVVVVGPCASGKSLLVQALALEGYSAYAVAQEHSLVPGLFLRRAPDVVVFLDASYESIRRRRRIAWGPAALQTQLQRLDQARRAADIVVSTDGKPAEQVAAQVLEQLHQLLVPNPTPPE